MPLGNLKPAHSGYRYQDIVSAYFLIRSVVGRCDTVTIDKKLVEDDRLDDLQIEVQGLRFRRQIKSSTNTGRALRLQDFTGTSSSLRIDRLVLTHKRDPSPVEEYLLCATWISPVEGDELLEVIEEVSHSPTIDGTAVKFFKLRPEQIWPEGGVPVWSVLNDYCESGNEFSRDDFFEFCYKFYIELEMPVASEDLLTPGTIEDSVLDILREDVGIGRYPNTGRQCHDVAALAVALATLARTQEATLTSAEISKALEIRTDFGRVSQAFPLDKNYFYDRPSWRQGVRSRLNSGAIHILTAPPGAGKSWELTCLSEDLADDYVVARHYCYLEPGDELVERRVTTDVFFANIIAEIRDVEPEVCSGSSRLSADLKTLEETLEHGALQDKKIVLVIDGVDHISRVKSASNLLSDDETDIIERIATLNIPSNVKVIIGSQPGSHLEPLLNRRAQDVCSHELGTWSENDVIQLAKLYRVDRVLASIGIKEADHLQKVLNDIAERSSGNPLFARYLCKGLSAAIKDGDFVSPEEWLSSVPVIHGDVAIYYKHLYDNVIHDAQAIADLFGVLDFSVTEHELREILPEFVSAWLSPALRALSPVLMEASGQGGVRIFHESFRRFMLDELERKGRNLHDVLSPVIDWLKGRGFFIDAKCYRFLLPALRKSASSEEIFNLVGTSFVSESVSAGHPVEAIQKNLAIAADVAGRMQNWPVLVRCAELSRALSTCFDMGQNSWGSFWKYYCDLSGADSLNDRLLFDGKPTLSYDEGLNACLLVDDFGGAPPWAEYLQLSKNDSESGYSSEIDHDRQLLEEESLNIATIQGRFRSGEAWRILRRFYDYLLKPMDTPHFLFIRKISMRFCRIGGVDTMQKLASRFESDDFYICSAISLGVADELVNIGEGHSAKIIAERILNGTESSSVIAMCMDAGAEPNAVNSIDLSLGSIDIGVGDSQGWPELVNIRRWVSNVRILSRCGTDELENERNRVQGEGWYRCWLRYVLALYEAESAKTTGQNYDLKLVFSLLEEDVRPFVGEPRACDLYRLHGIIEETLSFGLSLITNEDEWDHALEVILNVSNSTATRIDQEDGGPVSIGTVIDLIQPYASSDLIGDRVYSIIKQQVDILNLRGSYYSTHAEYTMQLASVQKAHGDIENSKESWKKVGQYLAGYGWRKDATLFEIIETASILQTSSKEKALQALEKIQPLVAAVLIHTDGRTTKRSPNAWFNALLTVDPASAIEVLCRTLAEDEGIENWPTLEALKSVARSDVVGSDPRLVDALWETIPFNVEYENEGEKVAQDRLRPLRKMCLKDSSCTYERLRRLLAEASNDANQYNYDSAKLIEEFSRENGYEIKCNINDYSKRNSSSNYSSKIGSTDIPLKLYEPPFPENASFVDILSGLRKIFDLPSEQAKNYINNIAVYISYKIDEWLSAGSEANVRRILHFYAREISAPLSSELHPLGELAVCLENAGHDSLAAIAYALAYTQSRGGGGWYGFGDEAHRDALHKAIELDDKLAKQTVSDDVSYRLRYIDNGTGITRGLIERICEWGDASQAASCWEEAFKVIEHRLPHTRESSWFAKFNAGELSDFSLDEGIVSLLLVRLTEPRVSRRISSLFGLLRALKQCPEAISRPLDVWVKKDTPVTSILLIFQLILYAEESPYLVTSDLRETFTAYAYSRCWGAAVYAKKLLERIGVDIPLALMEKQNIDQLPSVTSDQIEYVSKFDEGNLLAILSQFDSELPERVSRVLTPLLAQDTQVERIQDRLKLSLGREGKAIPPSEVIYWQRELFQAVLHEQACMVRESLWKKERWNDETELSILLNGQPEIALHLAVFNSRIPRPDLKEPCDELDGLSDLYVVSGDPNYEGWVCLGRIEEQFFSLEHSFSRPSERIKTYSGAVVAPIGVSDSERLFPFLKGEYEFWWGQERVVIHQRPFDRYTQLLSLSESSDWLADYQVLVPPVELCVLSGGVLSPDFGEGLVWRDISDVPIAACRFWHVQGQQFDVESPRLIGCDLVVRPDLVNLLEREFSCPIKLHTKVIKAEISG